MSKDKAFNANIHYDKDIVSELRKHYGTIVATIKPFLEDNAAIIEGGKETVDNICGHLVNFWNNLDINDRRQNEEIKLYGMPVGNVDIGLYDEGCTHRCEFTIWYYGNLEKNKALLTQLENDIKNLPDDTSPEEFHRLEHALTEKTELIEMMQCPEFLSELETHIESMPHQFIIEARNKLVSNIKELLSWAFLILDGDHFQTDQGFKDLFPLVLSLMDRYLASMTIESVEEGIYREFSAIT